MDPRMPDDDDRWRAFIRPDEALLGKAIVSGAMILATERRMAVIVEDRKALDLPYRKLRRIQFDIERRRPATLVVVPESPHDEPQVISVRAEEYPDVAAVLVAVGQHIADEP